MAKTYIYNCTKHGKVVISIKTNRPCPICNAEVSVFFWEGATGHVGMSVGGRQVTVNARKPE